MYGTGTKKMLNIMILKILEKHSDEEHTLTQKKIVELLDKEYGMNCDRRSVKANIISLKEMGYDIHLPDDDDEQRNPKNNIYICHEFEEAELRLLIDSVLFNKNLSRMQAKHLISKLQGLASKYFDKKINHVYNLPELQHSDNKQIALNLDTLNNAITEKKKVSFVYNSYGTDFKLHPRRERLYIVSPYQMAWSNGHYYLISNTEEYDTISQYRIDKITNMNILDEDVKPKEKIPAFVNGFNLPKHMAENIYMFGGKSIWVKFWTTETMMDNLIDWFGKNFNIMENNDGKILIGVKVNAMAMRYWALQYGESIEVIEPKYLRDKVRDAAKKIVETHS
ncbi:MAG: WYL domain-containing protein [Selenomonadaceae bacterium]|nr:WYL domain-containing protein [Selenomonadaceae bacterium]